MTDNIDIATPGSWRQTQSLTLLRQVMGLGGDVRHAVAQSTGLSQTEVTTLEHLAGQSLGPAEIARLLDVTTAASTGIVDRLETRGHVQLRPHPHDRRRTEVVITDSARREVLTHMGPMFMALARLDASLSEEDRAVIVNYLEGAVAATSSVLSPEDADVPTGPERAPEITG